MFLGTYTWLICGLVVIRGEHPYIYLIGNELKYDLLESLANVGIKICSQKCIQNCYCRSLGFNAATLTCFVLKRHFKKTESRGGLVIIPKSLIQGLSGQCSADGCRSGFNCITHYHDVWKCAQASKDQHYGETCSSHDECVDDRTQCIDSVCRCLTGYSFNPGDGKCIAACNQYGTNFSLLSHEKCSRGFNDKILAGRTFKECSMKCQDQRSFKCLSFEMWSRRCWLSRHTKLDMPNSEWRFYRGCKHYQRNCE